MLNEFWAAETSLAEALLVLYSAVAAIPPLSSSSCFYVFKVTLNFKNSLQHGSCYVLAWNKMYTTYLILNLLLLSHYQDCVHAKYIYLSCGLYIHFYLYIICYNTY